jgi:hypothetical protein
MLVSCASVSRYFDPMTYMEHNEPAYAGLPKIKKGYIESPYALNVGYVDIRGYQPGELVQCPYTGKVFRVPPQDQFVGITVDNRLYSP